MNDELETIRTRHERCEPREGFYVSLRDGQQAHADRATLLRALDEAQAALQFYADPANHIGHRDPSASVYIETSAVDTDGGKIARAALNQEPKA